MSRKSKADDLAEATETPEADETYECAVDKVAAATKKLIEVGLGGKDAGTLAFDIYITHKANPAPCPVPEQPAAE